MKKDLNFEVNILPILDILSVMICFLLLTAVWTQIGTLDTRQAIGDNSVSGDKNPPSLWINMSSQGDLRFSLRDLTSEMKGKSASNDLQLPAMQNGVNWQAFDQKIQTLREQLPELKTVVITPESQSNYGDVIKVMDKLKRQQLTDIGLSPLG